MCDVVQYRPRSDMFPARLYEVIVDAVEGKRQRLEVHQNTHYDVYPVDGLLAPVQDECPKHGAEEEDQRRHSVEHRQRYFACRQEIVSGIRLVDFYLKIEDIKHYFKKKPLLYFHRSYTGIRN